MSGNAHAASNPKHGSDNGMLLSVVLSARDDCSIVSEGISALDDQGPLTEKIEILVLDLGSKTGVLRKQLSDFDLPPGTQIIEGEARGEASARNRAAEVASADIVAFLDASTVPLGGWAAKLLDAFAGRMDTGVVGGAVDPIWPDAPPTWWTEQLSMHFGLIDLGTQQRSVADPELLATTNIAFRKPMMARIGGFDTTLDTLPATCCKPAAFHLAALSRTGIGAVYEPDARALRRIPRHEASQDWVRRSICWSAVMAAAKRSSTSADPIRTWRDISDYLIEIPRELRGLRGLFLDRPEAEIFASQCDALAAMTRLALSDGSDPKI
ncbi:MAG TPA: glycosyltransferase [Rhizomicrobium sp.]|jgi:glycosyltransferase involved in cell wall biosynthesis